MRFDRGGKTVAGYRDTYAHYPPLQFFRLTCKSCGATDMRQGAHKAERWVIEHKRSHARHGEKVVFITKERLSQ